MRLREIMDSPIEFLLLGLSLIVFFAGIVLWTTNFWESSELKFLEVPYASNSLRASASNGILSFGKEWPNSKTIYPLSISLPWLVEFRYFGTDGGFWPTSPRAPFFAGWELTFQPGIFLAIAVVFPAIQLPAFRRFIKWAGLALMILITARILPVIVETFRDRDYPWQEDMALQLKRLILISIPILPLFWMDWKFPIRKRNSCRRCDYDLTGNSSGICSECGTPIPRRVKGTPALGIQ